MFQLDLRDHRPLYEQIKEKMKALAFSGVLKADEKIPSVRELAQTLTINPNTIQKAYRDLEAEGFIYSIRGKGSFITPLKNTINQPRQEQLLQELDKLTSELMYLNIPQSVIIDRIEKTFAKKEEQE